MVFNTSTLVSSGKQQDGSDVVISFESTTGASPRKDPRDSKAHSQPGSREDQQVGKNGGAGRIQNNQSLASKVQQSNKNNFSYYKNFEQSAKSRNAPANSFEAHTGTVEQLAPSSKSLEEIRLEGNATGANFQKTQSHMAHRKLRAYSTQQDNSDMGKLKD